MRRNAALNITPEKGWRFSALSILPKFEGHSLRAPFGTDTVYLGSRTVEEGVRKVALSVPEADRFVEVVSFPSETIRGTHKDILMRTKQLIYEQVLKAREDERGLILGFSAWTGQQSLDVMDLVGFTRRISENHAVCIIGGPEFSAYSPRLAADFFAAGADIINFGGGLELAEWLGKLTKDNLFERDANGNLKASIPPKMPFISSLSKVHGVGTGGDLPSPVLHDPLNKKIYVYLPDSSCSNECDFCSVGKFLVDRQAPKNDGDIAKQVNAIIAETNNAKASRKEQIKAIIKIINAKMRRYPAEEPLSLDIVNPNPTQGQGFKRLESFLSTIDMTEPMWLVHYCDALSFRTEEGMQRHLAYFEKLLTEHKNLKIHVDIAIDAVQEKDDGDFIGRRIGKRLVRQDEYDSIQKNYPLLVGEISGKEWANRVSIGFNQIIHPAMTTDVYKQKLDLMCEKGKGLAVSAREFILLPHNGTRLAEKYKGHYAPMDYMEKDWELGNLWPSTEMSNWGNQFKNGDLLDCLAFCEMMTLVTDNMNFLVLLEALKTGWNDNKADLGFFKNKFRPKTERKFLNDAQKIFDTEPRIIGVMEHFMGRLDRMETIGDDDTLLLARGINASVHWILRRERYLAKNNPIYANDPKCRKLIKMAKQIRRRLLSKPYAYRYDICPQRNFKPMTVRPYSRRTATENSKYFSVHRPLRHLAHNTM